MLACFRTTPLLQQIRISRRCYTLLHHARVPPHRVRAFCQTYRLPESPFFPLFLTVKRRYLDERARRAEERRLYIRERMRELPEPILAFVKYLGYLEERYHSSGKHPLWQENLYPRTKKQVHAYARDGYPQWIERFRAHLLLLEARYPGLNRHVVEKLLACFVLECVPPRWPPRWPSPAEVKRHYRRLTLRHHPDRGGDNRVFVELKRARDLLLGEE